MDRRFHRLCWLFCVLAGAGCGNDLPAGRPQQDRGAQGNTGSLAYRDHVLVTARPRSMADVGLIWQQAEFVLAPHDPGFAKHELVVTTETIERLRSLGVPLTVEPISVQAMIDEASRGPSPRDLSLPHAGKLGIFGAFFDRVQQLDPLMIYLDELVAASAGRAQVVTLGRSVEDRAIKAIRISSAPEGTDRPGVIVTGTQHAREWASPMVTIGLADALVRQYANDAQVRRLVDTMEIFIIPVTNPDGYVASHNGRRLQRKNMNPRCNVDLNRNWGEWWGMGVPRDGCDEETYPGQSAFSEPETQAVRQLAESRKNLRFYMDYHSSANQIMYPPCFVRATAAQDEVKGWSELYAGAFAGVNGATLPPRSCFGIGGGQGGCSTDWFFKRLGTTLEMELRPGGSLGGFGLTNEQVLPFVEENWSGWVAVLGKVADKYGQPPSGPDGGADAGRPGLDGGAADSDRERDARVEGGSGEVTAPAADSGVAPATDAQGDVGTGAVDQRSGADSSPGVHPPASGGDGGCAVPATRPRADAALVGVVLALALLMALRSSRRQERSRLDDSRD